MPCATCCAHSWTSLAQTRIVVIAVGIGGESQRRCIRVVLSVTDSKQKKLITLFAGLAELLLAYADDRVWLQGPHLEHAGIQLSARGSKVRFGLRVYLALEPAKAFRLGESRENSNA